MQFYFTFFILRDEITEKYNSKLSTEMAGPIYEVMSKLIKAVTGSKITVPGSFRRYSVCYCKIP